MSSPEIKQSHKKSFSNNYSNKKGFLNQLLSFCLISNLILVFNVSIDNVFYLELCFSMVIIIPHKGVFVCILQLAKQQA